MQLFIKWTVVLLALSHTAQSCCSQCQVNLLLFGYAHPFKEHVEPGEQISYRCNRGWALVGSETRQCGADGNWVGPMPKCQKTCPLPILLNGGASSTDNPILPGSKVDVHCDVGFRLSSSSRLTCMASGLYNTATPVCVIDESQRCKVPVVSGAIAHPAFSVPVGDQVTYKCVVEGFGLIGASVLNCRANRTFDYDVPACSKTCVKPPMIPNGEAIYMDPLLPGAQVYYQCDHGFKLGGTGKQITQCKDNFLWTHCSPLCIRDSSIARCPVPVVLFARQKGTHRIEAVAGDSVTYQCDDSYVFSESSTGNSNPAIKMEVTMQCLQSGKFDRAPPKCSKTCPLPKVMNGNSINVDTTRPMLRGQKIEITCAPGYKAWPASGAVVACGAAGVYNPPPAVCVEDPTQRCSPPFVLNAIPNPTACLFANQSVEYSCDLGWCLRGDGQIMCLGANKFNTVPPTCEKVCFPPLIANGKAVYSEPIFPQNTVSFQCNDGYTLYPSQRGSISCKTSGLYDHPAPLCVRK